MHGKPSFPFDGVVGADPNLHITAAHVGDGGFKLTAWMAAHVNPRRAAVPAIEEGNSVTRL
jgi:hypothetical protein